MAGRIPQSFIDDLLSRVDIVDVISSRITLKKAGKDHQGLCPFHNEKTPSFTVSEEKQFYHCFGCGESGTAVTFLMEHDRLEFVEAIESLALLAGIQVPREEETSGRQETKDLLDVLMASSSYFRSNLKNSREAVEYLKARGITGITARDFGIGYAPNEWHGLEDALTQSPSSIDQKKLLDAGLLTKNDKGKVYDRFRGRIMFPIRDNRGRILGYGGRVFGDMDGPKYLNSPETATFRKSFEVYGLYEARKSHRNIEQLILVEGYMDVIGLSQHGITNVAATLGTAATTEHFKKLYRFTKEVVCCFDGDAAGRKAAWRAMDNALAELKDGRQLKFMFLPDGEDPDSLVRKEKAAGFKTRLQNAQPAVEYLFGQLASDLDLQALDGQAKLVSLMVPYIKKFPESILKQLFIKRLYDLTGYNFSGVKETKNPQPYQKKKIQKPRLPVLEKRLVAFLLKDHSLINGLQEEIREELIDPKYNGFLESIVRYLVNNPGIRNEEIQERWTGEDYEDDIVELLSWQFSISAEALEAEFVEGINRFVSMRDTSERRTLLDNLKEDPTSENLRIYWAKKKGANPKQ